MIATPEQVGAWLAANGVGQVPTNHVERAYRSAEAWVRKRVRLPDPEPVLVDGVEQSVVVIPEDLVLAVCLMTARYLARRNSPDGFVGMAEFGPARISRIDQDVETLIGPYRPVVFG